MSTKTANVTLVDVDVNIMLSDNMGSLWILRTQNAPGSRRHRHARVLLGWRCEAAVAAVDGVSDDHSRTGFLMTTVEVRALLVVLAGAGCRAVLGKQEECKRFVLRSSSRSPALNPGRP